MAKAKRGGQGNPPRVRLYDFNTVQVWVGGEWVEAEVEDHRSLQFDFEPEFRMHVQWSTDAPVFEGGIDDDDALDPWDVEELADRAYEEMYEEDDVSDYTDYIDFTPVLTEDTPCGAHSCLAGPTCDGYTCDDCGWTCPNGEWNEPE